MVRPPRAHALPPRTRWRSSASRKTRAPEEGAPRLPRLPCLPRHCRRRAAGGAARGAARSGAEGSASTAAFAEPGSSETRAKPPTPASPPGTARRPCRHSANSASHSHARLQRRRSSGGGHGRRRRSRRRGRRRRKRRRRKRRRRTSRRRSSRRRWRRHSRRGWGRDGGVTCRWCARWCATRRSGRACRPTSASSATPSSRPQGMSGSTRRRDGRCTGTARDTAPCTSGETRRTASGAGRSEHTRARETSPERRSRPCRGREHDTDTLPSVSSLSYVCQRVARWR